MVEDRELSYVGVRRNMNNKKEAEGKDIKRKETNRRAGYKNYKSGVSAKKVKKSVTRPASSAIGELKHAAGRYSGDVDNGRGGDGGERGRIDYGFPNDTGISGSSWLSRQRRNNEFLELLKAIIKVIKAVIVATLMPVLIALAVVYFIVATVVSILFGTERPNLNSGYKAGTVIGRMASSGDVSNVASGGDALYADLYGDTYYSELLWPCPSVPVGDITDDFGPRKAPTAGASTYHRGIDIGAAYGADIVATDYGEVIAKGADSIRGLYVVIDHGNGIETWYLHQCFSYVEEGDIVARGDVIGQVGESGVATGPHLHFEVHVDGEAVNPMGYFE